MFHWSCYCFFLAWFLQQCRVVRSVCDSSSGFDIQQPNLQNMISGWIGRIYFKQIFPFLFSTKKAWKAVLAQNRCACRTASLRSHQVTASAVLLWELCDSYLAFWVRIKSRGMIWSLQWCRLQWWWLGTVVGAKALLSLWGDVIDNSCWKTNSLDLDFEWNEVRGWTCEFSLLLCPLKSTQKNPRMRMEWCETKNVFTPPRRETIKQHVYVCTCLI